MLAGLSLSVAAVRAEASLDIRPAAEGVFVGPLPSGDDWKALRERGIQTVVGVDGLPPDVDAARTHGLRVVHIPIGYDGIDHHAAGQLTRVAHELPRPIYVCCHHGKHRGPAAAALVCRAAGLLDEAGAIQLLQGAGTDRRYAGLWRDVRRFQPLDNNAELPELSPRSAVSPLRLAMSQLDRAWDAHQAAATDQQRRETHLLVREALKESRRAAAAKPKTPTAMIERFDHQLAGWSNPKRTTKPTQEPGQSCLDCHERFRD